MTGPHARLGLILPLGRRLDEEQVATLVRDGLVESVWVRDLPVVADNDPDVGPGNDPWWQLGRLAVTLPPATTIGTASIILGARHPLVLARAAIGAQNDTGGRFVLGVGTGGKPALNHALGLDPADYAGFARHWHHLRSLLSGSGDSGTGLHRPPSIKPAPMYLATSDIERWRAIDGQADGWQTFLTNNHPRSLNTYANICDLAGIQIPVDVRLDVELVPQRSDAAIPIFTLAERGRLRCTALQLSAVVAPWLAQPVGRLLLRAHGHQPEDAIHALHQQLKE